MDEYVDGRMEWMDRRNESMDRCRWKDGMDGDVWVAST